MLQDYRLGRRMLLKYPGLIEDESSAGAKPAYDAGSPIDTRLRFGVSGHLTQS